MEHFIAEIGSNPSYSLHKRARQGDDAIENARRLVANILGVTETPNVVFTLNATQALNQVMWSFIDRDYQVLASNFEHASVTRPFAMLAKRRGLTVRTIGDPVTGIVKPEHVHKACKRKKAHLLVINHASNITGIIQPVKDITEAAHEHGCLVLLDAAQTAGVLPIEAEKWGVDFLAFSGHKHLLGPMGVGGFYVADPEKLSAFFTGSTGYFDDCDEMPSTMPHRYEPGSPNAPGIAGLGASCGLLDKKGIKKVRKTQVELTRKALTALKKIPEVTLYGPSDARKKVGIIGFNIKKLHPIEVGDILDHKFDIMVRTGLCSCHWANKFTGTMPDGLVRASMGYFTKEEDIDLLIDAVHMIVEDPHLREK